ncbi:MAG: glucose-1-phosphate thymidylyltransferase [Elusimicrobiota bacterium]
MSNIESYLEKYLHPNIEKVKRNGEVITKSIKLKNGARIQAGSYIQGDNIQLGPYVTVEPGAYIKGPAIIGEKTQIRQGAYVRGNVITGKSCVIGHATEIKNSVMLQESKAGHFAYIGDSILGAVNLGAGTKLANLKITGSNIKVNVDGKSYDTGLRKFGAILGDNVQTGCNSVTSPGTILSKNVMLYPNTTARGYFEKGTIVKLKQNLKERELKNG